MRRRLLPVIGVVALLAAVVVAAATGSGWTMIPPGAQLAVEPAVAPPPPTPLPTLSPGPADPHDTGIDWLLGVLVALAIVLLLLVLAATARRVGAWRRAEKIEPVDVDHLESGLGMPGSAIDLPVLADAVDAALARLDAAATPTDAVVAAWVSLEDAAATHGWERHPSETSTEFTSRLLGVSPAPAPHTATLRGLYQQARFTTHPVAPGDVARARTALEAIARALEGRPA
ncbi:DUF4129 domain-containing protein [Xylanimonas protaetiae]|uniref:DUF4129 domain-containing protein n=1 Tax=Xylanimonas protaetiae TaxID=2509457 RepID=A0A4P6FBW6_9MICO|nr:DUF4129 domain-containing protein [Xylanimonas protaetiae]QAY71017.1 DUF4129 domain-containing protein [Xylanimonas protaetiae]